MHSVGSSDCSNRHIALEITDENLIRAEHSHLLDFVERSELTETSEEDYTIESKRRTF